jgi:hypothetical protein
MGPSTTASRFRSCATSCPSISQSSVCMVTGSTSRKPIHGPRTLARILGSPMAQPSVVAQVREVPVGSVLSEALIRTLKRKRGSHERMISWFALPALLGLLLGTRASAVPMAPPSPASLPSVSGHDFQSWRTASRRILIPTPESRRKGWPGPSDSSPVSHFLPREFRPPKPF